jgi:hypothetical protein
MVIRQANEWPAVGLENKKPERTRNTIPHLGTVQSYR